MSARHSSIGFRGPEPDFPESVTASGAPVEKLRLLKIICDAIFSMRIVFFAVRGLKTPCRVFKCVTVARISVSPVAVGEGQFCRQEFAISPTGVSEMDDFADRNKRTGQLRRQE